MDKKRSWLCFFCIWFSLHVNAQNPTVREVVDRILKKLETEIHTGSVDTLKSGSWDQEVTGIATTFMATLEVLKKASANNINLILTHEPTYFNHLDLLDDYGEDDLVIEAKKAFIEKHNLVVFRFHDVPHQIENDMIKYGMIQRLGWENYHLGEMIFESPYKTLKDLSEYLKKHFRTSTVRVVGDPQMEIKKIGLLPGAYGRQSQVEAFRNPDIDVLLVGEAREWETVEYARDAQELGWERALIVMGHADSEEGGMEYVAEWLRGLFPGIPIQFIPAGNPLWSPE